MIAETEFRLQVEADITPYKSLLLGLFFMSVGMLIDVNLLYEKAILILGIAGIILLLKGAIIFLLCRLFGLKIGKALHTGLVMAQVGEFAFILFGMANRQGLMDNSLYQELLVATALTMALTPAMAAFGKQASRKLNPNIKLSADELLKEANDLNNHIIIFGYGRVGRVIAKVLTAQHEQFIAIDNDSTNVREGRKNGKPVLYGDATKKDILNALGLKRAKAVILTMNDKRISSRLAGLISEEIPSVPIIARAWDTDHVKQLEKAGAKLAIAEAYEIGLVMASSTLNISGTEESELDRVTKSFRNDDYALLKALSAGKKPA
jgi:CPA2 family monovalent cation:H+ antiporter-2